MLLVMLMHTRRRRQRLHRRRRVLRALRVPDHDAAVRGVGHGPGRSRSGASTSAARAACCRPCCWSSDLRGVRHVALLSVHRLATRPRALTTLLFVNNWVAASGQQQPLGSLNPTWSLAQEEQFYLIWPLVLCCCSAAGPAGSGVVGPAARHDRALLIAPHPIGAQPVYAIYFSPLDRAAELLLGCLGAVIWRHRLLSIPSASGQCCPTGVRRAQRAEPAVAARSRLGVARRISFGAAAVQRRARHRAGLPARVPARRAADREPGRSAPVACWAS